MAAEAASAAVILSSSHLGFALSTTHVATGSILGTGLGKRGAEVRWGVAGRMVAGWLMTLPAAAVVGATVWFIGHLFGTGFDRFGDRLAGGVRDPAWHLMATSTCALEAPAGRST